MQLEHTSSESAASVLEMGPVSQVVVDATFTRKLCWWDHCTVQLLSVTSVSVVLNVYS